MRISLLGHASLVVEAGGVVVWMDPVFRDPFHDGVVVSCPKRVVHEDAIPLPDFVFVSHAHSDHYDRAAVARARGVPFYCAPDPALIATLRALGAYDIRPLDDMAEIAVKGLRVVATPSRSMHERGALFLADGRSAWNLVDTAVDRDICADVLSVTDGALDVAIVGYQPVTEYAALWQSETQFPRARYDRLVECALATRARTIVPGSAGMCAPPHLEWVNPLLFPATRELFMGHLRDVAPEIETVRLDPGQSLVVDETGATRVEPSSYASMVEDDEARRRFDPVGHPPPPLVDENPDGTPQVALDELTDEIFERLLPALSEARHHSVRGPMRTLVDRRAVVEITIVSPKGARTMHVRRWFPEVELVVGAHADPDYTFGYLASKLFRYLYRGIFEEPMCAARRRANPPESHALPEAPYRLTTLDPARLHDRDLYMVVDDRWNWSILSILDDD